MGKEPAINVMIRRTQTVYEKKIPYRYWTTNRRRNIDRNRMGYKRRKDTTSFRCALGPEAKHLIPNRTKVKSTK